MTPAQIRQAVRLLSGLGYSTVAQVIADGKMLREVRNGHD